MTVPPIDRLTPEDLINLYAESPSAPARLGALCVLDGRTLLDPNGRLGIEAIRAEVERRLRRTPRLRQVIHRAGPLAGPPFWADDPTFRIERHVLEAALPAGKALTDLAVSLVNQPMSRAFPLWRMWFVTGLPDGRVGLVIALHHVIADGITTVRLIGELTDGGHPGPATGAALKPPSWARLVRDNFRRKASAVRAAHRPDLSQWREMAKLRDAPRTSLNRPVGARRRLAVVTMDLAAAKEAAHRHGGKVNDVVLAVAAGGLRQLLLARGEPVDGVRLNATVAVSLRDGVGGDVGNRSGGFVARLSLSADPHRRLREIALDTQGAKARQNYRAGNSLLVALSRLGLLQFFSRRQHLVNLVESNVTGPPSRLYLLGAPILDVVPIGTLVGNFTVGVLSLSYAGRLTVAVQADADRCPDLALLLAAMRRESEALTAAPVP